MVLRGQNQVYRHLLHEKQPLIIRKSSDKFSKTKPFCFKILSDISDISETSTANGSDFTNFSNHCVASYHFYAIFSPLSRGIVDILTMFKYLIR